MKGSTFLAVVLAVGVACAARGGYAREHAQGGLPDVVIFVLDDVADSDIDSIQPTPANPYRSLPSIAGLAAAGCRYTRFYAHAWCAPTRDSLLRSIDLGQQHGAWACANPVPGSLDFSVYNLARMFKDAGYHTAHVGKWHLGVDAAGGSWMDAIQAFGFDDTLEAFPVPSSCGGLPGLGPTTLTNWVLQRSPRDLSARVRDAFLAWWYATPPPRFGVLNFEAAHAPWDYPDADLLPAGYPTPGLGSDRDKYEAELVGADTAIGDCLAVLDEGDYRGALGDNGTPAGAERPDQDPAKIKLSCYEDGVRVPLIMAGPGIQPGTTSSAIVSGVDILVAFRDALGLGGPPVAGASIGTRDLAFCWSGPAQQVNAMIGPRWKLLTNELGIEELYDLETDPLELAPLPATGPTANYLRARRVALLGH